MAGRRRRGRFRFNASILELPIKVRICIVTVGIVMLAMLVTAPINRFLKELSSSMALSDASDMITLAVNETINRVMQDGQYEYDYFVTLEKNIDGNITAIKTNMARINTLSSIILREVVDVTSNEVLEIDIPLGNLLGSNLLLGRGPNIPVKIVMLTSSYADFRNELTTAGINQTKHQIIIELIVEVDIIIPWETVSTQTVSEILVAETIIVGSVPDTYLKME